MTDRRHRLTGVEERLDEGDSIAVRGQGVGVGDSARQDKPVVVAHLRIAEGRVDVEGVSLVEVVEV
jgi:hypothetical protein